MWKRIFKGLKTTPCRIDKKEQVSIFHGRPQIQVPDFLSSDLYFFCEHGAKALLLTVGIDPQSQEGIRRMISMHFIRPGAMPVNVARYLGNLSDRRKTAEYSRQAGWEFTQEEVKIYTRWAGDSVKWFLKNIRKNAPELAFEEEEFIDSIDEMFRTLGIRV